LGRYPEQENDHYDFGEDLNKDHQSPAKDDYRATSADHGGYSEDNEDDYAGAATGQKRHYVDDRRDGHGSRDYDNDGGTDSYADNDDERDESDVGEGAYASEEESARANGERKRSRYDENRNRGHEESNRDHEANDWNSLTLKELKVEAEKYGIDTSGMRLKKDYVEALENATS
jgi:hypothetical protein